MSMTPYTGATNIIQQLDDEPNDVGGLSEMQLKVKFDKGLTDFVAWFNDKHKVEFDAYWIDNAINAKHPPAPLAALKGDGADEGTAIQNLLNYCEANKRNLYFPKGIYCTSVPITFSGRFTIYGERGNTVIKALTAMEALFTPDNDLTNLDNDKVARTGQILDMAFNGDSKANTCLYIKQGKGLTVRGVECTRPVVQPCIIGTVGLSTYELIMDDVIFNATNDNGQAPYALTINQISDSWFKKILLINGSVNWLNITAVASTSFTSVHAYAYPESNAPDTGINVYTTGNTRFYDITCDTVKRVGMNITGIGSEVDNIHTVLKTGYIDTGSNDICSVKISGPLHNIDNVHISMKDATKQTRTSVVVYDNTAGDFDFKCGRLFGDIGSLLNCDLKLIGSIPQRFLFLGGTQATNLYKFNNDFFINKNVYSGSTSISLTFANPKQSAVYQVYFEPQWNTTWWITNKTVKGFTINFGTAPTAAFSVNVYVNAPY